MKENGFDINTDNTEEGIGELKKQIVGQLYKYLKLLKICKNYRYLKLLKLGKNYRYLKLLKLYKN
jgi:hypothetical protein